MRALLCTTRFYNAWQLLYAHSSELSVCSIFSQPSDAQNHLPPPAHIWKNTISMLQKLLHALPLNAPKLYFHALYITYIALRLEVFMATWMDGTLCNVMQCSMCHLAALPAAVGLELGHP